MDFPLTDVLLACVAVAMLALVSEVRSLKNKLSKLPSMPLSAQASIPPTPGAQVVEAKKSEADELEERYLFSMSGTKQQTKAETPVAIVAGSPEEKTPACVETLEKPSSQKEEKKPWSWKRHEEVVHAK